jgi:hypothetical protein
MRNTARQNNLSPRSYPQHTHSLNSENLRDPTATCCAQIHRLLQARTEKAAEFNQAAERIGLCRLP